MSTIFLSSVLMLTFTADAGGLLHDIELARPTPEELGDGWAYALGRKGPSSHGRTVNDGYKHAKSDAYVKIVISKYDSIDDAQAHFKRQITGFQSPPSDAVGDEARIEPRGSKRRPYTIICFRRANIVVTLNQNGDDHAPAIHVATKSDEKIQANLK